MPEARQNTSKLAEMSARASSFSALAGMAVDVVGLFMALLFLCGISTPSLSAQGGQRRSSYFNIDRDNSDNPRLRDNLKLVHPKTGRICFPPEPVNYAALAMVEAVQRLEQKHAGLYSSDWHEFESARQAQLRREAAAREEGLRAKSAADRRKYESKLLAADRKARGIVEETP